MRLGAASAVLTLAFALAFVAAPVLAQDEEPQPGPPLRLVTPPPVPQRQTAPGASTPAGIGATTLEPPDLSWGDALGRGEAALPRDLWQGTPRVIMRALLAQLGPTASPALRALAQRLLLSGGAIPRADDPADGPSLVLLRAQALARLGALSGARTVLDNVPAARLGDAAQRFRIELAFAADNIADACRRVAAGLTQHENAWWDQANIACDLLSGAREKAALSRDILHDRDPAADPLFDTLMAAADGTHGGKLDRHAVLTPLRASLWALSKRPLPPDVIATMDAPTAAAFAGSSEPVPNRLAAAERAAALGAWPPQRLAELYGKAGLEDPTPAASPRDERPGETPLARAQLFATARQNSAPARRVAALLQFLRAAQLHDLYFVGARLAAPIILAIGPGGATREAAPSFARALIAADHARDAAAWLPRLDAPAADPLVTVVHAIEGVRPDDAAVGESLATLALHAKDPRRAIGLYLALLGEYGVPLPSSELANEIGPARPALVPSAALWLDLRLATTARRRGEVVLASLIMAQDGLGLTTEPFRVQEVLAALQAAGFDVEARALARDVAVAAF
jgi:hypothetical protein